MIRTTIAMATLLAAFAGCSATNNYREASTDISGQLMGQLEQRTDMRRVRIYVEAFQRDGAEPATAIRKGRLYFDHDKTVDTRVAEWFESQLIADIAQRVHVVDRQSKAGPAANHVLKGRFAWVDNELVLIETRIVDLKTDEVLATANAEMRAAQVR